MDTQKLITDKIATVLAATEQGSTLLIKSN